MTIPAAPRRLASFQREVEAMKGLRFSGALLIAMCVMTCAAAQTPQPAEAEHPRAKFGDPAQYEARDLPATRGDLLTLQRAAELLASETAWNRNDDRQCADDEANNKRSLYCALERASRDVHGTHDPRVVTNHRRIALQEVRFTIEDATQGRQLNHRLMDFNNLPETDFADIQGVLTRATERVRARVPRE